MKYPLKRRSICTRLYSVTSQQTVIFRNIQSSGKRPTTRVEIRDRKKSTNVKHKTKTDSLYQAVLCRKSRKKGKETFIRSSHKNDNQAQNYARCLESNIQSARYYSVLCLSANVRCEANKDEQENTQSTETCYASRDGQNMT
jgi:hypothetical protein